MEKMIYEITNPNLYHELLIIWESAVKATHGFLKEEDFNFYKSKLISDYFPQLKLYAYYSDSKEITGFMGIDGNKLEMLFIHDSFRGKGIGKKLLKYAVNTLNVNKVDVNEQNDKAIGFYEVFGFIIVSRSETDDSGKPYPILHMSL